MSLQPKIGLVIAQRGDTPVILAETAFNVRFREDSTPPIDKFSAVRSCGNADGLRDMLRELHSAGVSNFVVLTGVCIPDWKGLKGVFHVIDAFITEHQEVKVNLGVMNSIKQGPATTLSGTNARFNRANIRGQMVKVQSSSIGNTGMVEDTTKLIAELSKQGTVLPVLDFTKHPGGHRRFFDVLRDFS